jgi:hypothetical protein
MGNHLLKKEIITESTGPKFVLIGGSSLGFSLDSQILQSSFIDYQIINYGTHAGLGLDYLMKGLRDSLNPEDIVVFSLEYEQFYSMDSNSMLELFTKNLLNEKLDLPLFNRYLYRTNKLFDGIIRYYIEPNNVYRNNAINQFGDIVSHHGLDSLMLRNPGIITNEINNGFIDNFIKIIDELESIGVQVYISFPPVTERYYQVNKSKIESLKETLTEKTLLVISNPNDFVYKENLFYDTHYHMTLEGSTKRTIQLNADLLLNTVE